MKKLLRRQIFRRLTRPELIKAHPFFEEINWDQVMSQSITPPFVPNINHDDEFDLSQFDSRFTSSSANTDTPVRKSYGGKSNAEVPENFFDDFDYVSPSLGGKGEQNEDVDSVVTPNESTEMIPNTNTETNHHISRETDSNISEEISPIITAMLAPLITSEMTPPITPELSPLISSDETPIIPPKVTTLKVNTLITSKATPLITPETTPLTTPEIAPFITPETTLTNSSGGNSSLSEPEIPAKSNDNNLEKMLQETLVVN